MVCGLNQIEMDISFEEFLILIGGIICNYYEKVQNNALQPKHHHNHGPGHEENGYNYGQSQEAIL